MSFSIFGSEYTILVSSSFLGKIINVYIQKIQSLRHFSSFFDLSVDLYLRHKDLCECISFVLFLELKGILSIKESIN
jgi:hypothetical protein